MINLIKKCYQRLDTERECLGIVLIPRPKRYRQQSPKWAVICCGELSSVSLLKISEKISGNHLTAIQREFYTNFNAIWW